MDCYSQNSSEVKIIVGSDFNIRKSAAEHLGSPDLWSHILHYNNIQTLSEIKPGTTILIPKAIVKNLLAKLDEANKVIQEAVNIGAKILADDLLSSATTIYMQAIKRKDSFEYDSALKSAEDAILLAKKAIKQTTDIRERTIDAIISYKKGNVQKMFPSILKWESAEIYDNLKENDWARTLSLSMANITFYDLSQIKLNENSQAVIQSSRYDVIGNKTTTKVTLEKGDAYAMLLSSPKKKFDLDIKGVKTKINSKYFWVEKNNNKTKLSNYNGEIALQVKDSSVVVRKNQGSIVPDNGYPTKPKNLIPPPVLISPSDLSNLSDAKQLFKWEKVNSAENYWLEIASDASFKKGFVTQKNIKKESIEVGGFNLGVYYWHVCSVDSLGLPGPYSEYRAFVLATDQNKPFLVLDSLTNNSSTRYSTIAVTGLTEPACKLLINDQKVIPDSQGKFIQEIELNDGKNHVTVKAININGAESSISRNIYFEKDSLVEMKELNHGLDKANIFFTDQQAVNLKFITRPFSQIELKSELRGKSTIGIADSNGICEFQLQVNEKREKFTLEIITQAHYKAFHSFEVVKNREEPSITLDNSSPLVSNKDTVSIKGRVINAERLFINEQPVQLHSSGSFSYTQKLTNLNNKIMINAVGKNESTSSLERNIIYDNQPPKLISYDIRKDGASGTGFLISVKAEDETAMKKNAEVEIVIGGLVRNEILQYDAASKMFRGIIFVNDADKPKIKSIALEDYISNKKIYSISK